MVYIIAWVIVVIHIVCFIHVATKGDDDHFA